MAPVVLALLIGRFGPRASFPRNCPEIAPAGVVYPGSAVVLTCQLALCRTRSFCQTARHEKCSPNLVNPTHLPPAPPRPSFRARFSARRNIWPFLMLVWKASPPLMVTSMALRLVRGVLPVSALWIGQLIVDEVVRLSALPNRPADLWGWWKSDVFG